MTNLLGSQSTELIATPGGVFRSFRGDLITDHLHRYQSHQRNEMAMLRMLVKPGDRIIDVGAHIGATAIPFANMVGSGGHVHAFEGSPDVFELLTENVALNDMQSVVSAEQAIVTHRPGCFIAETFEHNTGQTCFRRRSDDAGSAGSGMSLDGWWSRVFADLGVEARVDLIKVDVEGMEYEVLRGARTLIEEYRPILHVEIVPDHLVRSGASVAALDALLSELGYQFFVNFGERNSTHEAFQIGRLRRLRHGGNHFDVLAIATCSEHYSRILRRSIAPSKLRFERLCLKLQRVSSLFGYGRLRGESACG